jgi:hypothetical protein
MNQVFVGIILPTASILLLSFACTLRVAEFFAALVPLR